MASANAEGENQNHHKTGYPKEILDDGNVDSKYLCSLCKLVLRDPVQSFCGHRFCDACIKHLLQAADGDTVCPECGIEDTINEYSDLKKTFPDNAIKREFAKMAAKCINEGCTWTGPFKAYPQHETICEYQLFVCDCGKKICKHGLEEHKQNECPNRLLICPFCNDSIMSKCMEEHHNNQCLKIPMKCQGCGREGFTRPQLLKHQDLETGDCEARAKICPLNCGKPVETDLLSHMNEQPGNHIVVITDALLRLEKKILIQSQQLNEGQTVSDAVPIPGTGPGCPIVPPVDMEALYTRITSLEKQIGDPTKAQICLGDQTVGNQDDRKSPADGSSSGEFAGATAVPSALSRGQPDGAMGDVQKKIFLTDTKVNIFEDTLAVLTQQLDSFRHEADQLQDSNRELKVNVDMMDRKIKGLEKTIQLKDLSIAEADLKIQALEQTSYDGILTWKITDFAKKRQDSISGRVSSIYSPPFYTSKTGYKMCARLYLNGDGMGKGTHLSLFFVVMKGPYDALLKWPFRQKVTLMCLDQNQHEHIIDAFRPDPNSSSFRRPTSDMNIASGCPLFCQLSQLDHALPAYLRDDTMFIRIIVDATDI